jgi:hypothetical protein
MEIRGYGPVKEEATEKVRGEISSRLGNFMQVMGKAA